MPTKVAIGCVWAVGLLTLFAVLGSQSEETSFEIWMWTAGITGLCWPAQTCNASGPHPDFERSFFALTA